MAKGAGLRPEAKAEDEPPDPTVRAPVLDPTGGGPMEKGRVDRHLASGLPYDMTTTVTAGEGQVCVFVAVDHCTAECIGIHASLSGNRFEALERNPWSCPYSVARSRAPGLS